MDPVELPGPKPELVEAAKPESDMPPPELPILLPSALSVAARLLVGTMVVSWPEEAAGGPEEIPGAAGLH